MSDPTVKQRITIRVDNVLFQHAKSKPNVSRYIEGLIKQDLQLELTMPIVQAVRQELMGDEEFFTEVVNRVIQKSKAY